MRIVIDYNGSKVICRVTHYLNEKNPHYNDYTEFTQVDDSVYQLIIAAFCKLKDELIKNRRKPDWMHGNMWRNKVEKGE